MISFVPETAFTRVVGAEGKVGPTPVESSATLYFWSINANDCLLAGHTLGKENEMQNRL